ncbi:MAG TPA: helicase C-terminal domain-containing protein [Anaerolineaceae bacterium]
MPSMVAIDIETTGLDSQADVIIEIGAVRFNGHRVESEWTTLINPNRKIPPQITVLTGITNEMVRNAPLVRSVIHELADFVGDDPILGQSVHFDLSFLRKYGILANNDVVDTYELASVLMPTASRYNLGALGQALGVILPATHRALDDARCTMGVFLRLYEEALSLPLDLTAEFVRLSESFDWGASWLFQQILKTRIRQPIGARQAHDHDHGPLFQSPVDEAFPPLKPVEQPLALDSDEVAALLEYGGPFSRYFDLYENRPQQVEMLRAVTQSLNKGQHLLVEAGTGTGKSFAYLVPAALFAIQNGLRVVISTNTINLQEQLIKKDIPDLRAALGIDLHATVLKGRSNYLCPRRLELLRQRGPETMEEMRVLAKVLVWLQQGGCGDRTEINLNGPIEREKWMHISAEDEGCRNEVCLSRTGGACPFYRTRQAAQSAHLLIVNHALLLADVATGSRVLPDYDYLIIDEAHHLESATTNALSFRANQNDVVRLLRELGGTANGLLGRLLTLSKEILRPSDFAAGQQAVTRATDLAFRLDHDFGQFFQAISLFMEDRREGNPVSSYGQQERILPATRTLPIWTDVEVNWDTTHETTTLLLSLVAQLHKSLGELGEALPEELEDVQGNLADFHRRLTEIDANLTGLVNSPDQMAIYWAEVQSFNNGLALQVAPLHVGQLMEKFLWNEKASVILTSATLTTNGDFDYLRGRLSAESANELAVGSPFDYEHAALLYLANDIPEPSDTTNYQRAVEQTLIRLSKATGGRLMALFTSYAQLRRTSQAISQALVDNEIFIYEQGEGSSANALLENFRGAERAVLLGTRSFWEGVDIPGEALSVLVITKLPFDVPSDPIIAARSETFEDPFNEYSLPEAILRFRQGFGRLIRTASDRGVVAILDRRVMTKRYGKQFIESLPQCKLKIGSIADLPAAAAKWLNI